MNKLLVDEVANGQPLMVVVDAHLGIVGGQPILSHVRVLLVEGHFQCCTILGRAKLESDFVLGKIAEVFLGLPRSRSAQTLVVLDLPTWLAAGFPVFVVRKREEVKRSLALATSNDRGDELLEEASDFA